MPGKKRIDDLMEAIAFAEAGEVDTARTIASELFPEPAAGERILAVSGARGFSRRMVEDSVAMAKRLGYGIVALSVAPAAAKLLARLGGARRGRGAWLDAGAYRARAAEAEVPFTHAARSGDAEKAIADVRRRYRRIAFLLVDPAVAGKARFSRVDLPIFYLAES